MSTRPDPARKGPELRDLLVLLLVRRGPLPPTLEAFLLFEGHPALQRPNDEFFHDGFRMRSMLTSGSGARLRGSADITRGWPGSGSDTSSKHDPLSATTIPREPGEVDLVGG